jgi:predicted restriction endonuclease
MSLIIHKCFDDGLITIDQDYKIVLSSKIKDVELLNYLSKYNGVKINLPIKKEFYPDKKLLLVHNDEVFKG